MIVICLELWLQQLPFLPYVCLSYLPNWLPPLCPNLLQNTTSTAPSALSLFQKQLGSEGSTVAVRLGCHRDARVSGGWG